MGDADRDGERDLNDVNASHIVCISFFSPPISPGTIYCVYAAVKFTEWPKKKSHDKLSKNTPSDPTLASLGEQPSSETAQLVRVSENG